MLLLRLPPELIQHVLLMLDPASFYLCLQTSKLLREHALQSRSLLLEHMARLPGWNIASDQHMDSSSKPLESLLTMFTKQSARNLLTGISFMFDTYTWTAPRSMDRNLSKLVQFQSTDPYDGFQDSALGNGTLILLEVHPDEGSLNIYEVTSKSKTDSQPRLLYLLSPRNLSKHLPLYHEESPNSYRIVRIAWKGACRKNSYEQPPVVAILFATARTAVMTLIIATIEPHFGPLVTATYDVEPSSEVDVAVALAIDEHNEPVISWRCAGNTHSLTFYSPVDELEIPDKSLVLPERIVDMQVRDKIVSLYPDIVQIPYWQGQIRPWDRGSFFRIPIAIPTLSHTIRTEAHGIPVANYHHHRVTNDTIRNGLPTCVNTALKLSICRNTPADTLAPNEVPGAFLLKVIQISHHCKPFDHHSYREVMTHVFVARLSDTPCLTNLPSNGLKIAISPQSCRIALAAWRTLRVYSIEPSAFLDPECAAADHTSKYPNDFAFTQMCGINYYQNAPIGISGVVLEPVDVPSSGVIHGMQWRNEDELWAWTDEGVCKWNLGVWANERRGVSEL